MPPKVNVPVQFYDKKTHFTDFTSSMKFIKLYVVEHQLFQAQLYNNFLFEITS